jgi:hypothetical protein
MAFASIVGVVEAYAATKPCRQLGWRSVQPNWPLAFAFEAPRDSVPITTAASPAKLAEVPALQVR